MTVAFTTDHLDVRDRIPFWVDVASKTFYEHGFVAEPNGFAGRLTSGSLGRISLTICDCGPCIVTRSRLDTRRDDIDNYILSIPLQGRSVLTQGDQTVVTSPGMVMLHTTSRPLKMEFLCQTVAMHVSIPRRMLQSRIGDADEVLTVSTELPATGLVVDFIRSLVARVDKIDESLRPGLANQVVDLVTLAINSEGARVPLSTTRANALRRLKAEIEKRLSDPSLKPADAANAAGISVRYANDLLAEEGLSLERYIVQRRLERCRQALEDPLQAHRMIGEIAFAWGFSDHSHFTRRFRDVFGMTPGDCRQAALAGAGDVRRHSARRAPLTLP